MLLINANPTYIHHILTRLPVTVETLCKRKHDSYHFHDYTQIWYVLSGTLKHNVAGKDYLQTPGTCVTVPPYIPHRIDTKNSEVTPLAVSISFTDKFLTNRFYRFFSFGRNVARFEECNIPIFSELTGAKRDISDTLVRKMISEFEKHNEMDFDYIAELLAELLRLLKRESAEKVGMFTILDHANAVSQAIKYISEHFAEKLSIDLLSEVALMSRCTFTRSFKAITGMTVMEYIASHRINNARLLLLFSDKNLDEIARETGLCDKSHLSRLFSEHFGISPSKFRAENSKPAQDEDLEIAKRWEWLNSGEKFAFQNPAGMDGISMTVQG